MNLYLLELTEAAGFGYDYAVGFVIRAASSDAARSIIADSPRGGTWGDEGARTWIEPDLSTCEEIASGVKGASGLVLRSFNAG
jgi:hypothetical protein